MSLTSPSFVSHIQIFWDFFPVEATTFSKVVSVTDSTCYAMEKKTGIKERKTFQKGVKK